MEVYVGIDVHKKYCQAALMNDNGRVVQELRFDNNSEGATSLVTLAKSVDPHVALRSHEFLSVHRLRLSANLPYYEARQHDNYKILFVEWKLLAEIYDTLSRLFDYIILFCILSELFQYFISLVFIFRQFVIFDFKNYFSYPAANQLHLIFLHPSRC